MTDIEVRIERDGDTTIVRPIGDIDLSRAPALRQFIGEAQSDKPTRLIIDLTGSGSKLVYRPLPSDDPLQHCPDITRARETLDWEPRVALREGLTKTIQYFEEMIRKGIRT